MPEPPKEAHVRVKVSATSKATHKIRATKGGKTVPVKIIKWKAPK